MATHEERLKILTLIERGEITSQQGITLLHVLDPGFEPPASPIDQAGPEVPPDTQAEPEAARTGPQRTRDFTRWAGWWQAPLLLGVALIFLGAWAMVSTIKAGVVTLAILPAALLFLLGLGVTVAAVELRNAPQLNVAVRQAPGKSPREIHLAVPLPLGAGRWLLRAASGWWGLPHAGAAAEVLSALDNYRTGDEPLSIHVDGPDGEVVDIWI